MELIRTLSQMVNCLRSRGIRRKVAVVCPNDPHTEYVIIRSLREEIAEYLLVTDSAHLKEALDLRAASPDFVRIYEAGTPDEAAALAVQLVRTGEAEVLMKGLINTDNLLRAVLKKGEGLLPEGGVLSHVAVAQVPLYQSPDRCSKNRNILHRNRHQAPFLCRYHQLHTLQCTWHW